MAAGTCHCGLRTGLQWTIFWRRALVKFIEAMFAGGHVNSRDAGPSIIGGIRRSNHRLHSSHGVSQLDIITRISELFDAHSLLKHSILKQPVFARPGQLRLSILHSSFPRAWRHQTYMPNF
jgi:hypothetical protein